LTGLCHHRRPGAPRECGATTVPFFLTYPRTFTLPPPPPAASPAPSTGAGPPATVAGAVRPEPTPPPAPPPHRPDAAPSETSRPAVGKRQTAGVASSR